MIIRISILYSGFWSLSTQLFSYTGTINCHPLEVAPMLYIDRKNQLNVPKRKRFYIKHFFTFLRKYTNIEPLWYR